MRLGHMNVEEVKVKHLLSIVNKTGFATVFEILESFNLNLNAGPLRFLKSL